jgi:tRNA threonylcarbamoyladenosine biosynthesis protein TsaB
MILALETSSSLCAVCVLDETTGEALAEISNDIGRGHAERLMDDVAAALSQAGARYVGLTAIACGVGPGSFTGIRVGVAAARGFGLALKIPVHGVTSLQAIALQALRHARGRSLLVVQDAGREELHVQRFDHDAKPLAAPRAMSLPMLHEQLPDAALFACGSGAQLLAGQTGIDIWSAPLFPTAAAVARASRDPAMIVAPKPLYLRAPDAKPQAGFAISRKGS